MAEQSYNPFSGFAEKRPREDRMQGGSKSLTPVQDWSAKSLVPGKWKVVDASALRKAAGAKEGSSGSGGGGNGRVAPLTEAQAEEWRAAQHLTVSESCPPPLTDFGMLSSVPQYLHKKLTDQGFTAPTPIQAQAWPILLTGRDLVGIAKTGSGKTLAFMVPALAHIALQEPLRNGDGPMVVVLAPTRELAQQIEAETRKVLPANIACGCLYGGAPKGPQIGMLRGGVHIVVATPGRLIDLLDIKRVNFLRTTFLVMDEADRMLDMGFEPQVRAICGQMRPDRQTVMFSATWPREIQALAASFQKDFVRINVGSSELLANRDVTQHFVLTSESGKFAELKKIMDKYRNERVLVFCKTKKTADYLEFQLKKLGVDAMAIHGDKEQRQREFILQRFRRDARLCLVATDVAARGLDIKELSVVVNYDFPMVIDDYVHRIGRTGRAGAKGESFTFITKREDQLGGGGLQKLLGIIERAGQEAPAWMKEWGQQTNVVVARRNRNMMGGGNGRRGGGGGGGGAAMLSGRGSGGGGGGTFGLRGHGANATPSFSAVGGNGQNRYRKFESSDDDETPAAKRARTS